MVRKIIHSYDGKIFKVDYFPGQKAENPGLVFIFNNNKKDNTEIKKQTIRNIIFFLRGFGFHIMCINLGNISGINTNLLINDGNNNTSIAGMVHYCFTCMGEFQEMFPKMNSVMVCGLYSGAAVALQLSMRMLNIEKFILIGPEFTQSDVQTLSSCVSQGFVIYNKKETEKDPNFTEEVVHNLRTQKKVYIDAAIIENTDAYFSNKIPLIQKSIHQYFKNNLFDIPSLEECLEKSKNLINKLQTSME